MRSPRPLLSKGSKIGGEQYLTKGSEDRESYMQQPWNSRIANKTESPNSPETSVRRLSEQFGAFRQSYPCDINKFTGLLLKVKSGLIHERNASLWHRMKVALTRKAECLGKDASVTSYHQWTFSTESSWKYACQRTI